MEKVLIERGLERVKWIDEYIATAELGRSKIIVLVFEDNDVDGQIKKLKELVERGVIERSCDVILVSPVADYVSNRVIEEGLPDYSLYPVLLDKGFDLLLEHWIGVIEAKRISEICLENYVGEGEQCPRCGYGTVVYCVRKKVKVRAYDEYYTLEIGFCPMCGLKIRRFRRG